MLSRFRRRRNQLQKFDTLLKQKNALAKSLLASLPCICVCVCVYLHICFWFLSFMAYIQFDVLPPSPFLSCNHEINKSASMFESNLSLCQLFTFVFYMFFFISYMTLRCLWACRRPAPCFTTSISHLWSGKQASPIGGLSTPCCNTTSLERAMWRMSNACVCSPAPLRQFLMQS